MRNNGPLTVVITGASSGIGLATALAFAQRGDRLVLAARDETSLDEAAARCRAEGGEAISLPTDVGHEPMVEELARTALDAFGRIDVWINNAAVTAFGPFERIPADIFRQVIETDLIGAANGARAALPIFRRQGRGILINVGSMVSYVPQPYATPYVASKTAMRAFGECLRMELSLEGARDIHVCTVMPESVDTPLFQNAANFAGRAAKPMRPILTPEAVARAIVKLVESPRREVFVGNAGRAATLMHALAPGLFERTMARQVDRNHFQDRPSLPDTGNVLIPAGEGAHVHGGWRAPGSRVPRMALMGAAAAVPLIVLWRNRRSSSQSRPRSRSFDTGRNWRPMGGVGPRVFQRHGEESMKIRDVMTRKPEVVRPEATIQEAARKMDELNVGALPVCDGERLLGMITDRDITVRATSVGKAPSECRVEEVMTAEVDWCLEDDSVADAAEKMQKRQIRRLPIVDRDKRLVGIVALGDLATDLDKPKKVAATLERISEPSRPDRAGRSEAAD
jgi:short-subunit dehydrogenase/CBS domain-containing protein